jgi:hypothetical protein
MPQPTVSSRVAYNLREVKVEEMEAAIPGMKVWKR